MVTVSSDNKNLKNNNSNNDKSPVVAIAVSSTIPMGKNASGRFWKKQQLPGAKHSVMKREYLPNQLKKTWDQKTEARNKMKQMKQLENELKEAKRQEILAKKAERDAKLKRKMENEMKNTQVQWITNTEKLKTMNKKQLRSIKKMQMNKNGVVEFVSPWGKGNGNDDKKKAMSGRKRK